MSVSEQKSLVFVGIAVCIHAALTCEMLFKESQLSLQSVWLLCSLITVFLLFMASLEACIRRPRRMGRDSGPCALGLCALRTVQLACRENRVVWATDLGYCLQECFYSSHFRISLEIAEPLCSLRKYCLGNLLVSSFFYACLYDHLSPEAIPGPVLSFLPPPDPPVTTLNVCLLRQPSCTGD